MVVLTSYLRPAAQDIGARITETANGFVAEGTDFRLEIDEKHSTVSYKDSGVEIDMSKLSKVIMNYEIKNGSRRQQIEVLKASKTEIAKQVLGGIRGDMKTLAFTQILEDAVLLIEEQIKYRGRSEPAYIK